MRGGVYVGVVRTGSRWVFGGGMYGVFVLTGSRCVLLGGVYVGVVLTGSRCVICGCRIGVVRTGSRTTAPVFRVVADGRVPPVAAGARPPIIRVVLNCSSSDAPGVRDVAPVLISSAFTASGGFFTRTLRFKTALSRVTSGKTGADSLARGIRLSTACAMVLFAVAALFCFAPNLSGGTVITAIGGTCAIGGWRGPFVPKGSGVAAGVGWVP